MRRTRARPALSWCPCPLRGPCWCRARIVRHWRGWCWKQPTEASKMDLWAVVPIKERSSAKERLAPILRPEARQALALAMLEDVLEALTATRGIGGLLVVTV